MTDALRQTRKPTPESLARTLTQREDFYRNILDSLAEGVIITNTESRIVYANRAMEEISGYSQDQLMDRISYELLSPPANWPRMRRRLRERLAGSTESYEHELTRRDGRITWISVRATPYKNSAGEIVGTVGAINCIEKQKKLETQNEWLRHEIEKEQAGQAVLGKSPAIQKVLEQIRTVAPTCANVLVLGESGTGKELVARAIHDLSDRKNRPLVKVNAASVPKELFESEFFGHVKGAFTGAIKDRQGRFELADGGTLFLDEIGEIPLELQSKLLRVIQEGQFERIGEDKTRSVNVRIVAATNRNLLAESKAGKFRLDLYYRLSVFPIEVPPLRERTEDISLLAEHFLKQAAQRLGKKHLILDANQAKTLTAYDWPGNVRELQNVIERAAILAGEGPVSFNLGSPLVPVNRNPANRTTPAIPWNQLKAQENRMIEEALKKSGGRIYGPTGAAALLGMKPTTLSSKIHRGRLKK